jgi:hypothetical protein
VFSDLADMPSVVCSMLTSSDCAQGLVNSCMLGAGACAVHAPECPGAMPGRT